MNARNRSGINEWVCDQDANRNSSRMRECEKIVERAKNDARSSFKSLRKELRKNITIK